MKTFLIADTHFSHSGVTKFLREDGTKLRPWDNVTDMDEALIDNWNKVVSTNDRVYLLGDYVINRKALKIGLRLNGRKILVKGNHDIFKAEEYLEVFDDIRAYQILDNIICSHIPVHPSQLHRWKGNVHGHLHSHHVTNGEEVDKRYMCVSVEHINYTPIDFEQIRKRFT